MNLERWLDDEPPDMADMIVQLRDILTEFIRSDEAARHDMRIEGQEVPASDPILEQCRALLAELETWEPNPTLNGLIKWRG